jgi:peptidoglycan/xylan/chitin deacetylase (PgdA/CDA1 family)
MGRLGRISAALCLALLPIALVASGGAAVAAAPCSRGQVALTFDDGPDPTLTPRFLTLLRDQGVPATFFVVGASVRAHPGPTRRASALGFTIGNHTYRHENLTRLSADGIRSTLRRTRQAIVAAGARPSALMRPPYGSIDDRVRTVVRGMGLVPVLWTVDPRDWDGRSARTIVSSTLGQLRPGQRNVVILHDGVRNSHQTLLALPEVIRGARSRGYCFVGLGASGTPTPVVPRARISDASATEGVGGSVLEAVVTLDRATTRATSVRVRTVAGTAVAGRDFVAVDEHLRFPAGVTRRVVRVRIRDDLRDEAAERFTIRLSGPRGLRIKDAVGSATIRDDDPPPSLVVRDFGVVEPSSGEVTVPVVLRLGRRSERWVHVAVSTSPGTATVDDYTSSSRRSPSRRGR